MRETRAGTVLIRDTDHPLWHTLHIKGDFDIFLSCDLDLWPSFRRQSTATARTAKLGGHKSSFTVDLQRGHT